MTSARIAVPSLRDVALLAIGMAIGAAAGVASLIHAGEWTAHDSCRYRIERVQPPGQVCPVHLEAR